MSEYGFRWGVALVERACELPGGRRVITISTNYRELDVYISATGRSVRVFERGKGELRPSFPTLENTE